MLLFVSIVFMHLCTSPHVIYVIFCFATSLKVPIMILLDLALS